MENRVIKFRGKRVDNKEWVYGDLVTGQRHKKGKMYILPQTSNYPKGCNDLDGWEVIPKSVGQFTGMPDSAGKEIWEGDHMDTQEGLMEVFWINGRFIIMWANTGTYRAELYEANKKLTVTGNKHSDL